MKDKGKYCEPIGEKTDKRENTLAGWAEIILGKKVPSSKPLMCRRCGKEEADPITNLCEKCDKELHPKTEEKIKRELKVHEAISEQARK